MFQNLKVVSYWYLKLSERACKKGVGPLCPNVMLSLLIISAPYIALSACWRMHLGDLPMKDRSSLDNLAWWGLDCGVFFFSFIFQWVFLHKSFANHLMLENCLHEKIFWKKDYCWSSGSLYMNMCLFCVAGWHGIWPFHWKISACLFRIFWCEVWYHSQLNKPCKVDQGDFSFIPFLLWPTKFCANETYKTAVNATKLLFTLYSCFPLLLTGYIGICI